MKIYRVLLRLIIMMPSVAAAAVGASGWEGRYRYDATYGRTAGGTAIVIRHTIDVTSENATLAAEGYQIDEVLLCDVEAAPTRITLRFRSYSDGSTNNAYGVAMYTPGEALLVLEKPSNSMRAVPVTRWLGYAGLDGIRPSPGVYFRKLP